MIIQKKIMLLGDIGVGKTSLIRRLVLDRFDTEYKSTFGFNVFIYTLDGLGADASQSVRLTLWDTDGNLGVNVLRHKDVVAGCDAALVVGDVARPETHGIMADIASRFRAEQPGRHLVLILNKSDLPGAAAEAPKALHSLIDAGVPLVRTSAKTSDNVALCFRDVATTVLRRAGGP
jgi:small GTP-binding protein